MAIVKIYETYPCDEPDPMELPNEECMKRAKLPLSDMYRIVGGVAIVEDNPLEAFMQSTGAIDHTEQIHVIAA